MSSIARIRAENCEPMCLRLPPVTSMNQVDLLLATIGRQPASASTKQRSPLIHGWSPTGTRQAGLSVQDTEDHEPCVNLTSVESASRICPRFGSASLSRSAATALFPESASRYLVVLGLVDLRVQRAVVDLPVSQRRLTPSWVVDKPQQVCALSEATFELVRWPALPARYGIRVAEWLVLPW